MEPLCSGGGGGGDQLDSAVAATALGSSATKEHGGNTVLWLGSIFTFPFLCTQAAAWANICPRHHQTRYFSQSRFFFLLPSAGISVWYPLQNVAAIAALWRQLRRLKFVLFKKPVNRPHFSQKRCHFRWNQNKVSENDNTFERNEDCVTVFLKQTDFT